MVAETFFDYYYVTKARNFHFIASLNNLSPGNASSIYLLRPSYCMGFYLTEWDYPLKAAGMINRGVCISTIRCQAGHFYDKKIIGF